MKNPNKLIKIIICGFIALVIIAIIATISTRAYRSGKIAIDVKYAPFTANLTLNGKKIKNNSTNYISPGEYELVASLDHFTTKTETITISEETTHILGKLLASDDIGKNITKSNRSDFLTVEGIYGELANEAGDKIKQQYPILQYLPINNNFYSISFSYKEDGSPSIYVKADLKYIDIATKKLLSLDVDIADYDISFSTTNPFTTPGNYTSSDPIETIKGIYSNIINNYQVNPGKQINNYYITTIYTSNYATNDSFAHFKVILQKSDNTWALATTPQPLLTTLSSPNIPKEIINQANNL